MVRVTSGPATRNKHLKVRKATKGYRGKNHSVFRLANQAYMKAGQNAYIGRKLKKRQFRRLWITRLSIALRERGEKYSTMMNQWMHGHMEIDRKNLSELAVNYPQVFDQVVEMGRKVKKMKAPDSIYSA